MKVSEQYFDELMEATGSIALNFFRRRERVKHLALWFFVRRELESETTKLAREYLLELDEVGYVRFGNNPASRKAALDSRKGSRVE